MVYTPPSWLADSTRSARSAVVEEHQDGLDSSINGVVGGQFELGEDRIDVLLHRPLRQHQPLRDDPIAEPGCEFAEHLAFPRCQPTQRGNGPRLGEQRLDYQW